MERLRKRKEQIDLDAEIAASTAKLSVLKTFEQQTSESVISDGMESYVNKGGKQKSTAPFLNPDSNKPPKDTSSSYEGLPLPPTSQTVQQQNALTGTPVRRETTTRSTCPSVPDKGVQISSNAGEQTISTLRVLQKQQQITELLIQQQKASHLPPREIPIFEGGPLPFSSFMKVFSFVWKTRQTTKEIAYIF